MSIAGNLPTGTVTFLFSDIEGSTRLLQELGDGFRALLERHNQLLRQVFSAHGGTVVRTEGDAFFVVFPAAPEALAAAIDAQVALDGASWPDGAEVRVRIGMHTGVGEAGGDDYIGLDVHRAARIAAVGSGGQTLLSDSTRALVEHDLPPGVSLRDLGEHQLKDLLRPERLHDAVCDRLRNEFPPLRTAGSRIGALPTATAEFLGREQELKTIRQLLTTGGARLVTLTGPGGIGKTTLGLHAAAQLQEQFDDGVVFVELAAVRDPDGVFDAIIRAAGLTAAADGQALDALVRQLEARQMLLVLDNLEQVIAAAEGVAALLQRCPSVAVLATSREAFAVRGEHVLPVPPLSVPQTPEQMSAATAGQYEAVQLFVARAAQARPGFMLDEDNAADIAEVCARLDGLPLAIELAAARVKLFAPHDLRARLDSRLGLLRGGARDLPARQRTLRGAIEWSYELLDPDECAVFALLSLFVTARLEDVEAVAEQLDRFRDVDLLDPLTSLVDKSLVRSIDDGGDQRLAMFETMREYAAERLAEQPDLGAAARRAHAVHYAAVAHRTREAVEHGDLQTALRVLDADIGNLRAAWRYWLENQDLSQLNDLLESLWILHDARGWYRAAVELAQDLLAVLSDVPSTPDLVEQKAILAASAARGLLAIRGYTAEVDEAYRHARAILEQADELPLLFPVLRSLADVHLFRAEFDKAIVYGRQLLELAEQQHETSVQVEGHIVTGANLASLGDVPGGMAHLEQAIALFDAGEQRPPRFRLGPSPGVSARTTSAFQYWVLGEPDKAIARADEAIAVADKLNHPFSMAYGRFHVGFLALWREEYDLVHEHATLALEVADEHDYPIWRALALILRGAAMAGRGAGGDGIECATRGMSMYQHLDTPPVFWPLLMSVMARVHLLAGQPDEGIPFIDEAIGAFQGRYNFLYMDMPVIKGDLLLAGNQPEAAVEQYEHVLAVGTEVEARMPCLRAATRLVRLRRAAGAEPDGSEILHEYYDSFTDGRDTRQLADARTVLGR